MDLDAYVATHRGQWQRLEQLTSNGPRTGAEADELLDLYQRASTHLSVIRSQSPDPGVTAYLSSVLARARVRMSGTHTSTWRAALRFVTTTFPAALYRIRWWWVVTTAACLAVAFGAGIWALLHPEVYTSQLTPEEIEAYVGTDFENYYSEFAHHEFATQVWINNAWVSALCIAFGALGLPVIYLLATNVVNVGVAGALMASHDRAGLFFGLILPHGLLELSAVFVAGATGLRLFWAWISPGERTRLQAFGDEGRKAMAIVLGLVLVLLVSGLIEGFVTPSGLPTWARIAIGIVAETAFLLYLFVVGGRAAAAGATGDVADDDLAVRAPTVV
ncbi:MAG: stage II sporulation protein M [Phycicoccus sp.]|nr:stage II sporulation protein M [Phycicoccus sp.]